MRNLAGCRKGIGWYDAFLYEKISEPRFGWIVKIVKMVYVLG